MKKLYTLVAIAISGLSFGQLIYEPFDFSAGTILQTQPGYTLANTGDDLLIAANSLTYTGLAASTGNKLAFGGAGIDATRDLSTAQTAGTTFYSLLLNVSDLTLNSNPSTTGGYCFGFISTGTSFGGTLWIKKASETTFNIGVNARTTGTATVFGTTAYNINETHLIVVSYTLNAAAGDDVAKLWVNPSNLGAATAPTETATMTNTGGTDLASVSKILIRQGSATDTAEIQLDEIRVGTSWAEVTPPATAGLSSNAIEGLKMYPNPLNGNVLHIATTANAATSVQIFDILGKEVLNAQVNNNTVNVAALNAGVYMVKITEEGKTATRKLVKQ